MQQKFLRLLRPVGSALVHPQTLKICIHTYLCIYINLCKYELCIYIDTYKLEDQIIVLHWKPNFVAAPLRPLDNKKRTFT